MNKEQALLDGKIGRTFLSYLLPTVVGMITSSVYCLADVMFIGIYVGGTGLAALNIAMPIYNIYSALGLLLGVGGAITISVLLGAGEKKEVNRVFTLTIAATAAVGITVTIFGLVFLEPFARALGATPELLPYVMEYMQPFQFVSGIFVMVSALQVLIRADYNPKLVMTAAVLGNGLNVLFDWLFVGVWGWGLRGASAATAMGPVLSLLVLSLHYFLRKNTMHFSRGFLHWRTLGRILKNGMGTFILEVSAGALILMFNVSLLKVSGETAVAVYAIISNIAYVGKGIFNGISQASQPLVSVNFGAGMTARVKHTRRVALYTAGLFSALCVAGILLFPEQIVGLFVGADRYLVGPGASAARLYFLSFVLTGINTVMMYYYQSVERTGIAMAVSLLRGFFFILIGLQIFPALWGEAGVWLTVTFAEAGALIVELMYGRLRGRTRKHA